MLPIFLPKRLNLWKCQELHTLCAGTIPIRNPVQMGPGPHIRMSRILPQLCVTGDITRHGPQTILEVDGQDHKHTNLSCVGGTHIGTMLSLQGPPPLESQTTPAHRVESQTRKCIVQGLGHIQIGLPMSTGGMYTGLDIDTLN